MTRQRMRRQRGSAMVEFATAGIASTLLLISTFQVAMIMWNYHTLAFAVHEATRYTAVRGVGCTKPGNTCSTTIGAIATKIKTLGIGLPSATPIGTSMRAATSMRAGRENGMAQFTTGVATAMNTMATAATATIPIDPDRRSVAASNRRLHAAPSPVPSSSENSVTVNE